MRAVKYQIADMTICVRADLPITRKTFARKLDAFRVQDPGDDTLTLHHHFGMPADADTREQNLTGVNIPWTISREGTRWIYDGYRLHPSGPRRYLRVEWDADHTAGDIYHQDDTRFRQGELSALTGMTTDQIWLARVLADRTGCLIHASGVAMTGAGFLFVGHSSAGKSTIARQLRNDGEILAEDRAAIRYMPGGFRLYSTWCHLDMPDIIPASSPLRAICFLEKAGTNQAILITDRREILGRLLPCLVKPFTDADWWGKTLAAVDLLIQQVPAYRLLFDRSGRIVQALRELHS